MSVDVETIAVALGRTAPDSGTPTFAQWEMWISDARMLITARLGDPDELDQDALDYVVREAVAAQVRRPDDATTVDIRVDDAATSRTYKTSAGRVTIRDEWWDLLSPTASKSGAFSIVPFGGCSMHLPWCSLMLGALYCSCGVDIATYPIYELVDEA